MKFVVIGEPSGATMDQVLFDPRVERFAAGLIEPFCASNSPLAARL